MPTTPSSVLGLDVGTKRIGIALVSMATRLPRPLITLPPDSAFLDSLKEIIKNEDVTNIVIGLPRGLDGQTTRQTAAVEEFARQLAALDLPLHFQDEALTSSKAESELEARGKAYEKSDIDALAAVYILEDWLAENREQS
jgi:putative Holliday junction resolvase